MHLHRTEHFEGAGEPAEEDSKEDLEEGGQQVCLNRLGQHRLQLGLCAACLIHRLIRRSVGKGNSPFFAQTIYLG